MADDPDPKSSGLPGVPEVDPTAAVVSSGSNGDISTALREHIDAEGMEMFGSATYHNFDFRRRKTDIHEPDDVDVREVEQGTRNDEFYRIVLYGSDNRHPNYLIWLAHASGLHASILRARSSLVHGDGVVFSGPDPSQLVDAVARIGLDVQQLDLEMSADLAMFEGCYLHAFRQASQETEGRLLPVLLRREPFHQIRAGIRERLGPREILEYPAVFQASKWTKSIRVRKDQTQVKREQRVLRLARYFSAKQQRLFGLEGYKREKSVVIDVRRFTNLLSYYPLPVYDTFSGRHVVRTNADLAEFDFREIADGLTAAYIVTFVRPDYSKRNPAFEKRLREAEKEKVLNGMKGAGNRGSVVITHALPPVDGQAAFEPIKITVIPRSDIGNIKEMDERNRRSLLALHGVVAPEIVGVAGVARGGGLSNTGLMLRNSWNLYLTQQVLPLVEIKHMAWRRFWSLMGFDDVEVTTPRSTPLRNDIPADILMAYFSGEEIRGYYDYGDMSDEVRADIDAHLETLARVARAKKGLPVDGDGSSPPRD